MLGQRAAPAYDYYMLCVLLVEMMTLETSHKVDHVGVQLDTHVRNVVSACPNEELKSLMLKLLSLHDEYLDQCKEE